MTHLDGQGLAREHIDNGENADSSPIHKLIGDEIHTPCLIGSFWNVTLSPTDGHLSTSQSLTA